MPSYTSTPSKGRKVYRDRKGKPVVYDRKTGEYSGSGTPPKATPGPKLKASKKKARKKSDPFAVVPLTEAVKRRRREQRQLKRAQKLLKGVAPGSRPSRGKSSTPTLKAVKKKLDSGDYDPIAAAVDYQVIEPAKRAKILPKDKTTGQKISQKVAEYGSLALPLGPEIAATTKALKIAAKGATAGSTKVGGSTVLKRVAKPKRAGAAPKPKPGATARQARRAGRAARAKAPRARAEVTLRASQRSSRAVAKAKRHGGAAGRAKRAGGTIIRTEKRRERAAARRATGTKTGREVFGENFSLPALTAKAGGAQGPAAVRGHEKASVENPRKTLGTTARTLPGLVTVPVGIAAHVATTAGRAGSEALHEAGVPGFRGYSGKEILAPVKEEGKAQLEFAKQVAKVLTSEDSAFVQREVEDNLGLILPVIAGIGLSRVGKGRITNAVRELAESSRAKRGLEHGKHRGTPRVLEKKGQRKERSIAAANAKGRIRRETTERSGEVVKAGRAAKGSEVLREVPGSKKPLKIHTGDVAGFLVAHDIHEVLSGNIDGAKAEIARIRGSWKDIPEGMKPAAGKITSRDVVAYIERNPEILRDPNLHKEIASYKDQARFARETPGISPEHSERARYLPVAITRDIPFPEERFPTEARGVTRAEPTRGRLAKDVLKREAHSDKVRAKRLRKKAATREARARAMKRELAVRQRTEPGRAVNERVAARAERMEAQARTYREGAKRADAMAKAKRRAATEIDPAVEAEFLGDVRATGREPEYVYRGTGVADTAPIVGSGGAKLSQFPGKSKMRKGTAEEFGLVEEGLETMVREGIARPVARRESYKAMVDWLAEDEFRFGAKSEFTSAEAATLFSEGVGGVRLNPRTHVKLPRSLYKRAEDYFRGTVKGGDDVKFVHDFAEAIAPEAQRAVGKGSKRLYKIVPREAAEEFVAQMTTQRMIPLVAKVNKWTSFAILGTSLSWMAWQVPAEYAQAAVAQPKLLNPAYVRKLVRAYNEMPAEKRLAFESWTGVTTRYIERVEDIKLGLQSGDMAGAASAYSVLNRTKTGRLLKEIPMGITSIDRWKGGKIRVLVAAAKIDKDLNGRLNHFLRGMGGLYREGERVSKMLRDKPLSEQLAYWADHPQAAKRYQSYLDDVMGNWAALTRNERVASQMVIFYSFLRMSLRWTFYSFPKRHPVKASLGWWLAQQNANELKKLLKEDPSFFTGWAKVPLKLGDGEVKMLDFSRLAPGSNAPVEALGGGDVSPGTAALRVSQPLVTAVVTAATGVAPLTGEQEPGAGWQALSQILSLSPITRTADKMLLPEGEKRAKPGVPLFGRTKRQTSLDKLFRILREEESGLAVALQSMGFRPPRKLEYERDLAKLSRILETTSKTGTEKRKGRERELFERGVPKHKKDREVTRMKERYNKAQDDLNKLFRKYRVPYKGEEERFFDYYEAGYPDEGGSGNKYSDAFSSGESNKYQEAFGSESGGNKYQGAFE